MMQYKITPTNIQLKSSFEVRKEDFERKLLEMREKHPDSLVWNRSIKSLKFEWAAHNAFPALGIWQKKDRGYGPELAAELVVPNRVCGRWGGGVADYKMLIDSPPVDI